MKSLLRKLRTNKRQREGIAAALSRSPDGLLVPLNRAPRSRRTKELLELVLILQKIEHREAMLAEVERQLSEDPNYGPTGIEYAPSEMYAQANQILLACHWSPCVGRQPDGDLFTWRARSTRADWENSFVMWVLRLRARGDISLIRSCRNCEQWFYAVTNHQTYCSDRCRQQFHSRDESFKVKRRLYMRRFRKNEKSKNLAVMSRITTGARRS